jgi:hypothetical protein
MVWQVKVARVIRPEKDLGRHQLKIIVVNARQFDNELSQINQ